MEIYLQWIVNAWQSLSKDLIIKSFKNCALTIALDGSEDDQIHCFKPGGPIPQGLELLRQARIDEHYDDMARMLQEIDMAEDENNGYDSDSSVVFEYIWLLCSKLWFLIVFVICYKFLWWKIEAHPLFEAHL